MRNTRDALLGAAELLIRQRGYAGVSYADLAALVGVSKAAIHHYFPGKGDLALALLDAYEARYDEALTGIMALETDGLGRVRAYAALYAQGVERSLGCLCAAFAAELATLPDPLREALSRFFARHVAFIERVLVEGQGDGSVASHIHPATHARLVIAALEGALMMERVLGGAPGFASALDALDLTLRKRQPM